MQRIEKQVNAACHYDFSGQYSLKELLFFDIETTGLSADTSNLYLIGCIYYSEKGWQLLQWFADEYHEEAKLLQAFFSFASRFSILLHYNGNGFDIPYLLKKCQQYKLDNTFDAFTSIDLYKKFLPFKKALGLPSIKQKKVEELFGLYRIDAFSGGALIKVYGDYIHGKILKEAPSHLEELKSTLLLHNQEDLTGLLYITPILALEDLLKTEPSAITASYNQNTLILSAILPSPLPLEFSISGEDGFFLECKKETGILHIPVCNNQFKLYYENYKDYFYLPAEDCAVHKSIASCVDKEFRKKATKETCYTKIPVTEALLADSKQLSQCFQRLLIHYMK